MDTRGRHETTLSVKKGSGWRPSQAGLDLRPCPVGLNQLQQAHSPPTSFFPSDEMLHLSEFLMTHPFDFMLVEILYHEKDKGSGYVSSVP